MIQYQSILSDQLSTYGIQSPSCNLYLRFKDNFITFHTTIYDQPFRYRSFIVSFSHPSDSSRQHGNIIVFVRRDASIYALVQIYVPGPKSITDFVDIPLALRPKANELFPLLRLSDRFVLTPVEKIRHKCVSVPVDDSFCLTDIRVDYEHD
jgi:hypothetical protein